MSLWTSEPASVPKAHCEKRFARTLREGFRFALFVLWLEPLRAPTRYRRTFPPCGRERRLSAAASARQVT